jgi:hypothetical protein
VFSLRNACFWPCSLCFKWFFQEKISEVFVMKKKTEYGEWLAAEKIAYDTHIDLLRDQAKSGSYEAESGYSGAIAALQLKRDQVALKLQGMALTSDHGWSDVAAGAEDALGEIRSDIRDAITKI